MGEFSCLKLKLKDFWLIWSRLNSKKEKKRVFSRAASHLYAISSGIKEDVPPLRFSTASWLKLMGMSPLHL